MKFNKAWEKDHEDRLAYNEYNRLRQHRWNPKLNAISREAYKLAGGCKAYKEMTRDERLLLRRTAEDMIFRGEFKVYPKDDLPTAKPARRREGFSPIQPLEKQGWVYIMDTYRYLKIGKTWEDGLRARRSEARRWGPADIAHKAWFEDAISAEKEVHRKLARYKVEKENVGEELFNCTASVAKDEIKKLQTEEEYDYTQKQAVG